MLDRNCTEVTKVTRVKVGEKGRHAVFLNPEKREYLKIRIDGCIIVNQTACDYLVARDDVVGVLIELKGTDLPRALKQIEETLEYLKNKKVKYSRMDCMPLPVQTSFIHPKNSAIQESLNVSTQDAASHCYW
jgi:hypothetical protein